jgi:hypothetical protein
MTFYLDNVLPRRGNLLLSGEEFGRIRQRVASDLAGAVLEVAFMLGNLVARTTDSRHAELDVLRPVAHAVRRPCQRPDLPM